MTDNVTENWQLRAEAAESALEQVQVRAREKIVYAELKAEAIKAGIIDIDGIKLIDLDSIVINENNEVENITNVLEKLKHKKPWLFSKMKSSSAPVNAPIPEQPRQRMASEMSQEEWLKAKSILLKRR